MDMDNSVVIAGVREGGIKGLLNGNGKNTVTFFEKVEKHT